MVSKPYVVFIKNMWRIIYIYEKQFDWERFKTEKIAVHCKTEEEANDFCKKMHEHEMK